MMPTTSPTLRSDQEALQATSDVQTSTKQALSRIQTNLVETEDMGATTLEELYAQRRKLERIEDDGKRLHDNLDQADHLVSKLGSWWGGKRKKNYNKKNSSKGKKESNNSQQSSSSSSSASSSSKKSSKWGFSKSSKKVSSTTSSDDEISFKPKLFDKEQALYKGEHKQQVQQIVQDDQEIDDQLDQIGNQLTNILQMAQSIGSETKTQGQQLDSINTTISDARDRQKKGNRKIRKHM